MYFEIGTGRVDDLAQTIQLRGNGVVVVAYKQPFGINHVGGFNLAKDVVIQLVDDRVAQEVSGDDRTAFDLGLFQGVDQGGALAAHLALQHHRKAEPAAFAGFTLNGQMVVIAEQRLELHRVLATLGHEAVQFLKLRNAQRAFHLDRAQVVSGQHEAELTHEGVGIHRQVCVFGYACRRTHLLSMRRLIGGNLDIVSSNCQHVKLPPHLPNPL